MTATQPPDPFRRARTSTARSRHGRSGKADGGRRPADPNGGFFVQIARRLTLDLIEGDDTIWEKGPLERLAAMGQLGVHLHRGFWQPMDTLRDKISLENLWASGAPPWKVWT